MPETLIGWLVGGALGIRHALEPDHLAAISTLVGERPGPRSGAVLGVCWGIGHSLALLAVAVMVGFWQWGLSPTASQVFELGVALMLMVLGVRAIAQARRQGATGPPRLHPHRGRVHRHSGPTSHLHIGGRTFATRSLVVGLVHGLAGSGALLALVVARFPSWPSRLGYVAAFGVGSTAGMGMLSAIAAWPLESLGRREPLMRALIGASGCLCTGVGVYWAFKSAGSWLF